MENSSIAKCLQHYSLYNRLTSNERLPNNIEKRLSGITTQNETILTKIIKQEKTNIQHHKKSSLKQEKNCTILKDDAFGGFCLDSRAMSTLVGAKICMT